MIIKGILSYAKREAKEFKDGKESRTTKEKLWLTIKDVELSDEQIAELKEAFKDSGKKMTPKWVLEFEGYVNVSTEYELPIRTIDGEEFMLEDAIADGLKYRGAEVKVSLNVKEGAVYPNAMIFLTEGSALNAFAEFDNEQ